jgi:hypothetical protein
MTPEEQEAGLWREAIGRRMDGFESRLDENTATTNRVEANTRELIEAFKSWQGAVKVLDFLGRVAKPLLAVGALLAAIFAWKVDK